MQRQVQCFGCFFVCEAEYEFQFDDTTPLWIFSLKLFEKFVDDDCYFGGAFAREHALGKSSERQQLKVRARPRMIHKIAAHHSPGNCEEMTAVLPIDIFRSNESKKCFVYQCGG